MSLSIILEFMILRYFSGTFRLGRVGQQDWRMESSSFERFSFNPPVLPVQSRWTWRTIAGQDKTISDLCPYLSILLIIIYCIFYIHIIIYCQPLSFTAIIWNYIFVFGTTDKHFPLFMDFLLVHYFLYCPHYFIFIDWLCFSN